MAIEEDFEKIDGVITTAKLLGWEVDLNELILKRGKEYRWVFYKDEVYLLMTIKYTNGVFDSLYCDKMSSDYRRTGEIKTSYKQVFDIKIKEFMEWL